jgi:LPS-assembly protein
VASSAKGIRTAVDSLKDSEASWNISAKSLTYDEKNGTYHAEGDVVIEKAGQVLRTQNAIYNIRTGIAKISGGLRLETDGDIITGKKGSFNLKTQAGDIEDASLFLKNNHYYIGGSHMEKTGPQTYVVKDCRVTTCDGVNPDWMLTGSEVNVTVEGYGSIKNAAFRVKGLPILYFPYMLFPAKTKRQSGLLPPSGGYSTLNGVEVEVPFFWAISDQMDATFYQRFMSSRGYMQGGEFRYLADEGSKGVLEFNILSDKENNKNMSDQDALGISPFERTNSTRYWLRGKADQDLPLDMVARLDMDYVSDLDYLREFEVTLPGFTGMENLEDEFDRPMQEKRSPTRRSALRVSHDAESYSIQGSTTYYQQVEDPATKNFTPEPLAGLNYTLLQEQIKTLPIFFNVESNYDYIYRDEGDKGHNLSIAPEVNFPFWLGPYVEFEPSFKYTYNSMWVNENIVDSGESDRQYESAYEFRGRLTTDAQRVFDAGLFNASKLKHKMRTSLDYNYSGYRTDNDTTPWATLLSQDNENNAFGNRVTLRFINFLDARIDQGKGRVVYNQWAQFRLNQSYDIEEDRSEEEDNEPFGPLETVLIVTPFPNLDFRGSAGWNHYSKDFSKATLSGTLAVDRAGGRKDNYEINYRYINDGQSNLNFLVNVNILQGFSAGGSMQRDLESQQSISTAGWLGFESQCWGVRLGAEQEVGQTNVIMVLKLTGLGDSGGW